MLVYGVCLVVMAAFCLLPGLASAQLDVTEWVDLPGKISTKMLSADELGVTDCPATLKEASPNRVVMQYIMNTFYKWSEYDLAPVNGKPQFCVVMQQPLQKKLSREEAQTLLSASELWKEGPPPDASEAVELSASDPQLKVPPRVKFLTNPAELSTVPRLGDDAVAVPTAKAPAAGAKPVVAAPQPETVLGADTRVRVTATTVYPWSAISYLGITFPGAGSYRGSGTLVGPYCVLTAGHMVYDDGSNQWVNYMLIAPGQRQDTPTGTVIRPYGTRNAVYWMSNTSYVAGIGFDYDYGAGLFSTPFTGFSAYMPIQFDLLPSYINLAGYPPGVLTETNSQGMWWSHSPLAGFTSRILRYTADTSGGNSGGPVWLYNSSTNLRRQAAVHVFGSNYYNGGCRLVSANMAVVQAFMNWRPATPPAAPTNVQASDGTYSDKVLVTWSAVSGATSYKVYRNTVNNSATASYRGSVTASPFNDTWAEPGVVYYYWVKASKAVGDSAFSLVNGGYRLAVYTTLTINGSYAWGSIYPMGDADWFRIVVTTPGTYVIQTWAGTLSDNYMWLYGPNSTSLLIAYNDDGGPGLMANITRTLSVGTYYIKIKPYYAGATGNYVIRVESAPIRPPTMLVNSQTPTAVTINFGGDTDTYSFVVATAGTHTINTTAGTLTDNFMFLYGPNSQTALLQTDDDGGLGYMAKITRSLAVGTYYVRFISYWGWGAGASGTFTARVTKP